MDIEDTGRCEAGPDGVRRIRGLVRMNLVKPTKSVKAPRSSEK